MAEIMKAGTPSVSSVLTLVANQLGGVPAGEDSAAGNACHVNGNGNGFAPPGPPRLRPRRSADSGPPRRGASRRPMAIGPKRGAGDDEVVGAHILRAAALDAEQLMPDTTAAIYLRDISRVPLLLAEEEVDLARAIERGDAAGKQLAPGGFRREDEPRLRDELAAGAGARRKLTESNLRLVVAVARKYRGRGLPLLDLIQEGSIGLSRAVEKYDYRKGYRFSTYAYWWIRQAATRSIADHARTIRLPVHVGELLSSIAKAQRTLASELGREPALREVAEYLELPVARVAETLRAAEQPISLEAPVGEAGERAVGDMVPDADAVDPEAAAEGADLARRLDHALGETLTERERAVVRLRFGLGGCAIQTLGEIGHTLGISRERVRQLEAAALRKLRPGITNRLREYLE